MNNIFVSMYMTLKNMLPAIVIAQVFHSCSPESSQIGTDFFQGGALDISSLDSSTVELATVRFDSLVTNNASRVLVGTHADDKLGRITAALYFQPVLSDVTVLDDPHIVFDGISLLLHYDGYSYYDTTSVFALQAFQLSTKMKLASDGTLYNTSSFPVDIGLLGMYSGKPRPGADSVEIELDETFGATFFTKAKDRHNDFKLDEKFSDYIKGFLVVPDTTLSSAMIGLLPTPELRLYYLDKNEIPAERKYISFPCRTGYSATSIHVNRSATKLISLPSSRERLSARVTDNEAYLQAGAGLALRVDMPYLRELKQHTNFYMTRAVLQIQPIRKSFDAFTALPGELSVYVVDKHNALFGEYTSTARLIEDETLGRDTYYEVDATSFVEGQMNMEALNENALMFLLPDVEFRTQTQRIYFSNTDRAYATRLIIYYATITN